MNTDNNTIRELDTDSIGLVQPKEHFENKLKVDIPNDVWNDIVKNYNHGWDEDLRNRVVGIMDRFMVDFVESEMEKYELDNMDFSFTNLYRSPFGWFRGFNSYGNIYSGMEERNLYNLKRVNHLIVQVEHLMEKDSFEDERDRWKVTTLNYRFTRLDSTKYQIELYKKEDYGYLTRLDMDFEYKNWGDDIPQPLHTFVEDWKTIREWIKKNTDKYSSKVFKQKYWRGLMIPGEYDVLKKGIEVQIREQEKEDEKRKKKLESPEFQLRDLKLELHCCRDDVDSQSEKSGRYQKSFKRIPEILSEIEELKKEHPQLEKENK